MTIIASARYAAAPSQQREAEIRLSYGPVDVEELAETLGISVCDEETQSILDNVDAELVGLTGRACEAAIQSRIGELLHVAQWGHLDPEDDCRTSAGQAIDAAPSQAYRPRRLGR